MYIVLNLKSQEIAHKTEVVIKILGVKVGVPFQMLEAIDPLGNLHLLFGGFCIA